MIKLVEQPITQVLADSVTSTRNSSIAARRALTVAMMPENPEQRRSALKGVRRHLQDVIVAANRALVEIEE